MLSLLAFSFGSNNDAMLDATSSALSESADACLISVRDRGTKYHETPACTALDALATGYIEAGGGHTDSVPLKSQLKFTQARLTAWMALATSESCSGRPVRIW